MESVFGSTGHEMVDTLRGLQIMARDIGDPDKRIEYVRETLKLVGATDILGDELLVTASDIWGRRPDAPPGHLIPFRHSLTFVAKAHEFGYLYDPTVPLDTLTINFEHPEVWGVVPDHVPALRGLIFRVPVLAIQSCMGDDII